MAIRAVLVEFQLNYTTDTVYTVGGFNMHVIKKMY